MDAVDYRQLQAPAQVRTDIPSDDAALRAQALADVFKETQTLADTYGAEIQKHAGELAGAASGNTGHPEYKTGVLRFTAYSRAFNNAATGAYAVQAEAQADDSAARLKIQANNDPAAFEQTYSAVRDAVLKSAPRDAVPMLTELYNRRLATVKAAITGDQLTEQREQQRKIYDVGLERDISQIADLQGSANATDHALAEDQWVKFSIKLQSGVDQGLYSKAVAEAKMVNAHQEVTKQVFMTQLDRELALMSLSGDSGDVAKFMDTFRANYEKSLADTTKPPVLSEPEFDQLYGLGKQKMQQERLIYMYNHMEETAAQKEKYAEGSRQITIAMGNQTPGPVLAKMVVGMINSRDLDPAVGRAVLNSIEKGRDAPYDPLALYLASRDPRRFDWDTGDILTHAGGNAKAAEILSKQIQGEERTWESQPAVRDAQRHLLAGLNLPHGMDLALATDAEKNKIKIAQDEFFRVMNKIPEAQRSAEAGRVANNVVLEQQARSAESKANNFDAGHGYADVTWGPKGSSPDPVKYAQAIAEAKKSADAERTKAAQLRKGITPGPEGR